jgi:ABC-type branched-subunit amino acid transport system substrate-binding protein
MPPRTKAAVKELVEDKEVFAFVGGVGTAPGMAVKKYLDIKQVPWVGPAAGSTHWAYPPTRYLFAVFPLYCDEADILISYAVEKLGKKRIAIFYQNDDYGKLALVGARLSLQRYGMELVADVPVEIMDTDLSSHCNKLKESEADCVLMFPNPKHGAVLVMTAAKMGFKTQWMATSTLSDVPIMYKITKGLFKDVIYVTFAELPESTHPLMKKYREAHDRFAPKDRWGAFFYAGIGFAEPLVEGLKRAGRDLTAEKLVEAMESLKDFQGIGPALTFGPGVRQGTRSSFLVKCEEGARLTRISDWLSSELDIEKVLKEMRE